MSIELHDPPRARGRRVAREPQPTVAARSLQTAERLANERAHVTYLCAATLTCTAGFAVHAAATMLRRLPALRTAAPDLAAARWVGVGMMVYGLALMLAALARYRRAERAIDARCFRPESLFAEAVTVTTAVLGVAVLWIALW